MELKIFTDAKALGEAAAAFVADKLNAVIAAQGAARLLVSTGMSQFEMFESLVTHDVDWSKVEMFHLDEYIGMTTEHGASFRRYLEQRFVSKVPLKAAHYVSGEGSADDVAAHIAALGALVTAAPIDLGIIGIGENGHIAFNDPPADFDTIEPYIIVTLDERCRRQQLGEGWFPTFDDVPKQAISMSVHQIMQCKTILSVVPHAVKAEAVKATLDSDVTPTVPATMLKRHADWHLYVDENSAALLK